MRTFLASLAAVAGLVLLTPVLLLLSPLLLVGGLTRALARGLEPTYLTRDQLIQFDPQFGWRALPNLNTHHLMVDLFHIRTDADGWRGRHSLQESELIVFGDSFAAGYGVSEKHFFANLTRTPRIKPIGIGGYSMVQEYLWMRQLAPQLRGKTVVWFVYFGNDLYDNLCPDLRGYRKPFVRRPGSEGEWEIYARHVREDLWPIVTKLRMDGGHHMARLAELCCPSYLSRRAYSACSWLVQQAQQLCAQTSAELIILTIPDAWQLTPAGHERLLALGGIRDKFDPDYPDLQIESICREHGVGFLPGKSFLDVTCYKSNDCHWNEKGHRKVAQALSGLTPSPKAQLLASRTRHALSAI